MAGWALGALVLISLLVGLRPYRQLLATTAAGAAPRCGGQRLAAALLPAGDGGDRGGAAGDADGASTLLWAILGGMAVLALLLGGIGWGSLLLLRRITLKSLALRLAVNRLLHQPW